jgi:uncharacterized protein with von Willebrand factor type A (vWA) domain
MKKNLAKLAYVPFILAILVSSKIFVNKLVASTLPVPVVEETFTPVPQGENRVQLAILLDVSGSMSGLIEQAKSQLWNVVNQLGYARRSSA